MDHPKRPTHLPPSPSRNSTGPQILGADADTSQQGYATTSVRVDTSRGVFYFLQEN